MKDYREFFKINIFSSKLVEFFVVISVIVLSFIFLTHSTIIDQKIGSIGISTSAPASEIREAWGPMDSGSLLDVALTWSKFKSLDETEQYWIVRAWAPGMAIIEVPLIWMEKMIPIYWSLLIITFTLWSSAFFIYWKKFRSRRLRFVLILTFLGMMLSWDFKHMFVDTLFHSEALGFGLLFLSLTLANFDQSQDSTSSKRSRALIIGIFLGLSLWIRHTSDFGMIFLLFSAYATLQYIGLVEQGRRISGNKKSSQKRKIPKSANHQPSSQEANLRRNFKQIVAICLIALAVTLPWRIIGMSLYGNTKPVMSSSFQTLGPQLWALPGSEKALYWQSEGMNWACEIDLEKCKKTSIQSGDPAFQLQQAITTGLSNPQSYLRIRSEDFQNNWIPDNSMYPSLHNFIGLLQGLLIFASIYLFLRIKSVERITTLSLWGSFILLNFVQLLIVHYESRYFIPVRLLFIGLFLNLYKIYESESKRKST